MALGPGRRGVPGALRALATRARADAQVVAQVYADIYRLSHQIGAGQRAGLAHLAQAPSELAELQARQAATLRRQARNLDARDQELAVLRGMAGEAEAPRVQVGLLRERVDELESGRAVEELSVCLGELEPRLGRLEQERERALAQAMDWRDRCEAAEARILVLQTDLTERAAEAQVLEGLLLRDLAPPVTLVWKGIAGLVPTSPGGGSCVSAGTTPSPSLSALPSLPRFFNELEICRGSVGHSI